MSGVTLPNVSPINVTVSGGLGPAIIIDGSATSVVGVIGINPFIAGQNITISTSSVGITIAAADAPVSLVQGRTGEVVLSIADITAAAVVHTHSTSDVSGLTTAIVANSPVSSVQGQVGVVVLEASDLTAAAASHTHSTSDVSGLATAIVDNAPVVSVQGRTGQVVVSVADLSAASVAHTHSTSDIAGLVTVVSVNGITGTPVVVAGQGITVSTSGSSIEIAAGDGLPQQGGNASGVLSTDGTAAAWATRYSVVDPVLVQGTGVTLTRDTSAGSITIEADVVSLGASEPLPLGVASAGTATLAAREDHIHRLPTVSDLTAAAAVHTHSTNDVSGLSAAIAANSPVSSVQGKVGTVTLSVADLTAAAAVHTHATSDVSGLAAAIADNSPVVSVQGRTGQVIVSIADLSAASNSHTHSASEISNLTSVANVVSINGITGTPVVVAGQGITVSTSGFNIEIAAGDGLPGQAGNSGSVLSTDGTTASWNTRFSVVDPVLVQGSGVTITRDTSAGSITIGAVGGTSGVTVGSATPQPLGVASVGVSSDAAREDHVHAMPTIADLTAAAASHTHLASDVSDLTSVANVVSVNGITGQPTIVAGSGVTVSTSGSSIEIAASSSLPSQGGNADKVLATDGTAAAWVARFSIVDPVLVAGSGILLTANTSAGSITIGAAGGVAVGSATPQPLGVAAAGSSENAAREDHVHAMPTISDLTAAAAVHSHAASDVTSGVFDASLIPVISYTSLSNVPPTFTPSQHTHAVADVTDLTTKANVVSVNGATGVVVISNTSVSAAAAVHQHAASDVTSGVFDASRIPVISYTSLSNVPVTFQPSQHTHVAADVTDLTTIANVVSVNGMTGAVTISASTGETTGSRALLFLLR